MEKPYLLHFLTPMARVSPFDVNMAYDAGWDAVIPYAHVDLDAVTDFTQDAIFSRGPRGVRRTGLFIGGRDAMLAVDMLRAARRAMVPPFEVSVFADPSGAYTTAAAMIAKVEHALAQRFGADLSGKRVVLFGGTGPVGQVAAVMAAQAGAQACVASHRGAAHAGETVASLNERFSCALTPGDSGSDAARLALLRDTDVVLAVAKAGVQVLTAAELAQAPALCVAADLNAVPPAGIETVDAMDDARPLDTHPGRDVPPVGIGALAIGNVKYKTQQALLQRMRTSEKPVYFGFTECLEEARRQLAEEAA